MADEPLRSTDAPSTPSAAERRERYAEAVNTIVGYPSDTVIDAVMAVADAEQAELRRQLAAAERIRANADFHLGQEMARRQLAEREAERLRAKIDDDETSAAAIARAVQAKSRMGI